MLNDNIKQMKRKIKIYTLVTLWFALAIIPLNLRSQAPAPPIPVEILPGHDNLYFQMVLKKSFAPESRLGFFTVTTFSAGWDDFHDVDITIPIQLYYEIGKGFAPVAGVSVNTVAGFSPYAGFQHNYASRKFLAVTVASVSLDADADFKIFGLYEYRPPFGDSWSFYSRLQFIYDTSLSEGTHNRSFLYLRAGVKHTALSFGLGANLDRYGPFKTFEPNYGPFFQWAFN